MPDIVELANRQRVSPDENYVEVQIHRDRAGTSSAFLKGYVDTGDGTALFPMWRHGIAVDDAIEVAKQFALRYGLDKVYVTRQKRWSASS